MSDEAEWRLALQSQLYGKWLQEAAVHGSTNVSCIEVGDTVLVDVPDVDSVPLRLEMTVVLDRINATETVQLDLEQVHPGRNKKAEFRRA